MGGQQRDEKVPERVVWGSEEQAMCPQALELSKAHKQGVKPRGKVTYGEVFGVFLGW